MRVKLLQSFHLIFLCHHLESPRIEGNYSEIVGDSKEEFKESMRAQLAITLDCHPRQIRNMDVRPGELRVVT